VTATSRLPSVGDRRSLTVVADLTRTQLVQYAGASGDYNPLHTDEVYATRAAGYPTVFAHGMLTMGMTARVVTDWFGPDHLRTLGARFRRQVWPGDTLVAHATVTAVDVTGPVATVALELSTVNQDSVEVLSGYATANLDL
jgi:acyl dehydratase